VPIAWYLAAAGTVSALTSIALRETKGIDLADVDRADSGGSAGQHDPAIVEGAA
jgi:hypothetical protein